LVDLPPKTVPVANGVPAKVISYNGSKGYIGNTDYDKVE
jgi:hypothetical protein